MGHEVAPGEAGDRTQGQHRIDEGAHEDPEGHLVAEIPDEVAHHPRPELLRGQGQGQDGDGEHHPDRGDDGGGDGDQDLPAGVGASRPHPPGQAQVVVVRGQVDFEGGEEQEDRDHDEQVGTTQKVVRSASTAPAGKLEVTAPPLQVPGCDAFRSSGSVTALLAWAATKGASRADQTSRRSATSGSRRHGPTVRRPSSGARPQPLPCRLVRARSPDRQRRSTLVWRTRNSRVEHRRPGCCARRCRQSN